MLSNVGTFYANKAGINQQVGVIDVNTSSVGVAFASTNRSSLNVSINTDQKTGMISKEAGIADNVVNSFIHEKNHLDSPSLMGTPQGEINAIQSQVLDPSFTNTTSTYKGAIVSYAAQKLTLEISQGIKLGNVQRNILNLNNMLFGIGRFTYDATSQSVLFNLGVEEITVTAPKIK